MATVDMKVERDLLDSNFEGYKLSLDSIPCYKTELETKLHSKTLSDDQFSFFHAKLFASSNVLVQDDKVFENNGVYILDGHKVYQVFDKSLEGSSAELRKVWTSNYSDDDVESEDLYNSSLAFPSSKMAVYGDGQGTLYILDTKDRNIQGSFHTWTILHKNEVCGPKRPFVVCSSMMSSNEDSLHILIHYIEEKCKIESLKADLVQKAPNFVNVLELSLIHI